MERDRRHLRALHGHGIVSGLAVSVDNEDNDGKLKVSAGMAVDRDGREICVDREQCGSLRDWATSQSLPAGFHTVYIVLCHDECATDEVPIPGGPCLSHDDRSVPSRVLDGFCLEFRAPQDAPLQVSDAVAEQLGEPASPGLSPLDIDDELERRLHAILEAVVRVDDPADADPLPQLLERIDALVPEAAGSPPGSPPEEGPTLSATRDGVRAALAHWIRVVRPRLDGLLGQAQAPCGPWEKLLDEASRDPCVVLARIEFEVAFALEALFIADGVEVDHAPSPLLLPARMLLQLLAGAAPRAATASGGSEGAPLRPTLPGLPVTPLPGLPAPVGTGLPRVRPVGLDAARGTLALVPGLAPSVTGTPRPARAVLGRAPVVRYRRPTDPANLPSIVVPFAMPVDLAVGADEQARDLRVRLAWAANAANGLRAGQASWRVLMHFFAPGEPVDVAEDDYARQTIPMPEAPRGLAPLQTATSAPFEVRAPLGSMGNLVVALNAPTPASTAFNLLTLELVYLRSEVVR